MPSLIQTSNTLYTGVPILGAKLWTPLCQGIMDIQHRLKIKPEAVLLVLILSSKTGASKQNSIKPPALIKFGASKRIFSAAAPPLVITPNTAQGCGTFRNSTKVEGC
jgi:hypothetical protein